MSDGDTSAHDPEAGIGTMAQAHRPAAGRPGDPDAPPPANDTPPDAANDPGSPDDSDPPAPDSRLILIGVGASAGGLEAFQTLLATLRPDDPFALILVQHLDPEHESMLPELLSKRTRLPVTAITDGAEVEAGHIYLIPPAFALGIEGRRLRLSPFDSPRGLRRPIDGFFEALAREHGQNCAGFILSGTGSDGSQGVRAIKEAGGLVFAQTPADAKYDGMPRAAIATGATDMVVPAGDMISVLRDFHSRQSGLVPALESDAEFIEKVVRNVRFRTGHDFAGYKHGTLLRRITLRMSVLGLESPGDYLRELVQNRTEAERLFRDLLINVTAFFRDPEAFAALRREVIPAILEGKTPDDEVRIWVPGCSTGQEAYTLAILFAEEMSRSDARPTVSIFGTDIDEDAVATARRGQYPNAIATEVPPALLDRYFTASRLGYELRPEIRDMVRFSIQSLIKDPPFSKLDLVTCRNLLIYFDNPLQDLSMRVFQYALRPGGFLMLGSSEGAPQEHDGFSTVLNEHRLYRRTAALARPLDMPRAFRSTPVPPDATEAPVAPEILGMARPVAEAMAARFLPPYLVVNPADEVTQVGPGAEAFVQMPRGRTTLGVRALILPLLEPALKRLLTGLALERARYRRIEVALPETAGPALPAHLALGAELLDTGERIITFEALAEAPPEARGAPTPESRERIVIDEAYVGQLEDELEHARATIRTTVEELETSNEELKSSNEEMMSMNEELQSANEELSTTNDELQNKLRELAEVNADLANFMESTQIATVFLDSNLRLRSYTPEATLYFRFAEQDRGREISDIGARLDMDAIVAACSRVAQGEESEELGLTTADGRAEVQLRVAPYRSEGLGAGGVVFSIFDVTKVASYAHAAEEASAAARASAEEIEGLYRTSPGALGAVDAELRYLRANPKLAEIDGLPPEAHVGRLLTEISPAIAQQAQRSVARVFETGRPHLGDVVRGRSAADPGAPHVWQIDWFPLRQGPGEAVTAVAFTLTDVTQLLELQADLRRIMRELQHRVKNMLSNVIALVKRASREQGEPAEILATLSQRIGALANTHSLLTAENWASTSIRDILALELIDRYGEGRVEIRGPELRLNARATLAIGMVLHEMATNALRHGALSTPEGRVSVRWSRVDEGDGDRLVLRWQERGGPEVGPPARQGFGTQLVQSMVEGSLGGEIRLDWEPQGLTAVVVIGWDVATEVDYDSEMDPLGHADPVPGR